MIIKTRIGGKLVEVDVSSSKCPWYTCFSPQIPAECPQSCWLGSCQTNKAIDTRIGTYRAGLVARTMLWPGLLRYLPSLVGSSPGPTDEVETGKI